MNAPVNPAFEFIRSKHIESLKLDVSEYRHVKTGAQHIHIGSENDENVFLVALRTVPRDSTGVAQWTPDGVALCIAPSFQTGPTIASAFFAWHTFAPRVAIRE